VQCPLAAEVMRDNSRMRASDLDRLREPYDESTNRAVRSPMAALGADLPDWRQLKSLILEDLSRPQWDSFD